MKLVTLTINLTILATSLNKGRLTVPTKVVTKQPHSPPSVNRWAMRIILICIIVKNKHEMSFKLLITLYGLFGVLSQIN